MSYYYYVADMNREKLSYSSKIALYIMLLIYCSICLNACAELDFYSKFPFLNSETCFLCFIIIISVLQA